MKKVTFITFYNDFSVGVNILTSVLINAGYDVSVIFFKLPSKGILKWFSEKSVEYMEGVDTHGNIFGGNAQVNRWTTKEIQLLIELINKLSPDIIALNSRSMDNTLAIEVYPKIKEETDAILIAGGFGPTLDPELYADLVDYVYIGEAEGTIVDLISNINNREAVKQFDGICYKEQGIFHKNKLASPDKLIFKKQIIPEQTYYIDNDKIYPYILRDELIKTSCYSTFLGRGCISTCSYCSTGNWRNLYKSEGYVVSPRRNRKVEHVIEELIDVKKRGITFVHFRDEFMTAPTKELKKFFILYEKKVSLPFWAYLVPHQILDHPELLKLAVDAGFVDTELGFQSGSDQINSKIFTRKIPTKCMLDYTKLLEKYDINMKYDFIIFNPAEESKHIQQTYKLIQELPKKRSYLFLLRLFYFKNTPINKILEPYHNKSVDFAYYYRLALLYLICFVTSPSEFTYVLSNKKLISSWQELLNFYKQYLRTYNIEFMIGTHTKPDSITSHRYKRIIEKNSYKDIIVWGAGSYYKEMSHIFLNTNIKYHIDERKKFIEGEIKAPSILKSLDEVLPIFVCTSQKKEVKMRIITQYPELCNKIYV